MELRLDERGWSAWSRRPPSSGAKQRHAAAAKISGEQRTALHRRRHEASRARRSAMRDFKGDNEPLSSPLPTLPSSFNGKATFGGEAFRATTVHHLFSPPLRYGDGSSDSSPTAEQSSRQQQSSPVVDISVELSASSSSQQRSGGFLPLFPASMRRQRS
nr:hypothetical protein Itr_chr04CG17460 [Ipomoea trifida]